MARTRKTMAALLSAAALVVAVAPAATANPSPPTNGGNGAGQSGQCTGKNADRPASCQSPGGTGNQP
jgi:Spy/CpxP family protein refolding chaperone